MYLLFVFIQCVRTHLIANGFAQRGCDVFNALDVMENGTFFKDLKFGVGDGQLQYYIYNWKTSEMKPSNVGLVLM